MNRDFTDVMSSSTKTELQTDANAIHLALCITTYLRPVGLKRLLAALEQLEPAPNTTLSIIVIDNDPSMSAQWVDGWIVGETSVRYVSEPQRGITFARNAALRVVSETDADWIGWIDDDEAPRPDWLRSIIATQRKTGADVVSGPSEPHFDPDAKQWIVETGSFGTERFETGSSYPFFHTRTSGVIINTNVVPFDGFDDRLALIGGEDRLFFTHIHRSGGAFVWDDNAVVDEWVPTSRVSLSWLAKRWFRTGVTRSLTLLYMDSPGVARRLRRVAGGLAMAAAGLVATLRAAPGGKTAALAASRKILLGLGASWGALGFGFREYQKVHGT